MADPRPWLGILCAAALVSCAPETAQFSVRYAPEFAPAKTTVSMFGVYRDGRMSPESWAEIEPALAAALGQESCEAIYASRPRAGSSLLTGADEYTRANGMTDELLERFAPRAAGELIVTVSIVGRPEPPGADEEADISENAGPPPSAGPPVTRAAPPKPQTLKRGGRRRVRLAKGLEMSAAFYSIKLHRSVARVSMKYAGKSFEEGVRQFVAKLAEVIPGSTCRGWKLDEP